MATAAGSPVVVSGVGACTCLGGAIQGAAAARASILRAAELDFFRYIDQPTKERMPLVGHAIKGVTEGFQGVGRLIRMGIVGLEDLQAATPWLIPQRTAFFMALPRPDLLSMEAVEEDEDAARAAKRRGRSGPSVPGVADMVAAEIAEGAALEGMPEPPAVFTDDRHGALRAVQAALAALRERRYEAVVVGACDTELDEARLARALAAGRLKTKGNPVGFMPGEASAFLLLERQSVAASRQGRAAVPVIDDPSLGIEENSFVSERPAIGRGLTEVATAALGLLGNPGERHGSVFSDINGEPFRSADWGHALVRLRGQGLLNDWSDQVTALSFGETGAAGPLLALILATRSFARQYAPGDTALVLTSDDGGNRGAVTLHQERSGAR